MEGKNPIEKYIGALGLIGILLVVFYGSGIVLHFKRIKREKLAMQHLKQHMSENMEHTHHNEPPSNDP